VFVAVKVAVFVGVFVAVKIAVLVGVRVGVFVLVNIAVSVAVAVGVVVGVLVGVDPQPAWSAVVISYPQKPWAVSARKLKATPPLTLVTCSQAYPPLRICTQYTSPIAAV
jgi:hypothetical protein